MRWLMLILFVSLSAVAEEDGNQIVIQPGEGVIPKSQLHKGKPFYGFFPYMPRQREYAIELGSMWEEQTMYWAGVKAGWHVGNCVFTETQTCQQYWDLVGGVGGRDGYTLGLILTGPRWQFVSYPSIYSPSLSLFVGALNISDEDRDEQKFAYGIGYGWTMAVHGDSVEYKGTGLALEFEHRPQGKSFVWGIKAGQATGDDSGSDKSYDGFIFDRNYDIAMMLFNHQLGNADFLQTGFIGGGGQGGANGNTGYDVEAISNATYIAPYFNYQWKPKWLVTAKFVTGTLNQEFNDGDTDLGFEVDLGLNYKSDDNFVWVNEVGFFTPGKAFEGGSSNFDTDSALGFVSKIAITF